MSTDLLSVLAAEHDGKVSGQPGPGLLVQLQPLEGLKVVLLSHAPAQVVGGSSPLVLVVGQLGHHLLQPTTLHLVQLVVLIQHPGIHTYTRGGLSMRVRIEFLVGHFCSS